MQTVGESPNIKELYFGSEKQKPMSLNEMDSQMDDSEMKKKPSIPTEMAWLYLVLYAIAAYYAVRLSWTSNTRLGYSEAAKVLFAIFAFMFPFLYLTAHLIFKMDLLKMIETKTLACRRPAKDE
jgi:hypothetical protein